MSLSRKVLFNTSIQILGRGIVVLVSLVLTALLTRKLGLVGFGNYIFITASVFFFVSLADWGTGIISTREAAKTKDQEAIFSTALLTRFLVALFFLIVFNFFLRLLPQFNQLILPATVASFLIVTLSLRTSLQIIFQTKIRFWGVVLMELVASLSFLILILIISGRFLSLITVFWALVVSSFVACGIGFFFARRMVSLTLEINRVQAKKIFWEALPTGALLFVFSIYNRIDIFILQSVKGSQDVGVYGLAYKIHENLILGAAYLLGVLFPILSRFAKDGGERLLLVYRRTFDILFLIVVPMVIFVFLFAQPIISLIAGSAFLESVLALRILLLATFFAYFNHLTGYTLIALGKQKVSLIFALIALVFNIILNLILIPRFSFVAAAFVTVATEGLVFSLSNFYLGKKFRLLPSFSFFQTGRELVLKKGKIF